MKEINERLHSALGWESLDAPSEAQKNEKAMEVANQIHNAFRDGSGKYVLEHFINTFLTKPIVRPGEDAYAQGIREGRADVVRQILYNIELSKQGE